MITDEYRCRVVTDLCYFSSHDENMQNFVNICHMKLSIQDIATGYLTYHQITTFCVEWKLVYWFRYIFSFSFFSSQGLIVLWKTRCSWQLLTSNDLAYQACITWRQGLVSQKLYELIIEISLKKSVLWWKIMVRSDQNFAHVTTADHDSSAVVTCAKLWPDWIVKLKITA